MVHGLPTFRTTWWNRPPSAVILVPMESSYATSYLWIIVTFSYRQPFPTYCALVVKKSLFSGRRPLSMLATHNTNFQLLLTYRGHAVTCIMCLHVLRRQITAIFHFKLAENDWNRIQQTHSTRPYLVNHPGHLLPSVTLCVGTAALHSA